MASNKKKDETEKMRKLAQLKETLEKKVANVESELEDLKILLEFVDENLLEKGFKRAKIAKPKTAEITPPPVMNYKTVIPLKTAKGELLANLCINQDSMRAIFSESEKFNVNTPPFQQFLIERVLDKMREKDSEAASRGELVADNMFSYELILDGDILREIVIKNLTADRLRELKSSIHWTLEKMYEKLKKNV